MSGDLVIGIDAGTAGVRAGLFDLQGQPLGFSDQGYLTRYPRPGWAEQHPIDWWEALVSAVQGCLQAGGVDGSRVIGLAVDAPCDILLTDHAGRPLTGSLMWMGLRDNIDPAIAALSVILIIITVLVLAVRSVVTRQRTWR